MKAGKIETFDTVGFLDRYVDSAGWVKGMPKDFQGDFFIVSVQDMLRASRLPVPPVRSTGHTLVFLTEGEANMKIGFQAYRITGHQCLVVPAGQVFSYDRLEENQGYVLHFKNGFLLGSMYNAELLQAFDFLNVWGNAVITLSTGAAAAAGATLSRMLAAFLEQGFQQATLLQSYLLAFLEELAMADAQHPSKLPSAAVKLHHRFQELLFIRFRELKRVNAYADLLAVSPNHLNKAVKEATGKSPSKWIDEAIVLEAKVLLYQTDLPVAAIAMQLGIDDNSYFSRLFKRYEGISPNAFRKRIDLSYSPQ